MKASELRIGNYVKGIGIKPFWLIEGIKGDLIYALDEWRLLNSFEPIPLTEEWLLKLGFDKLKEYDDGENIIIQYGKSIIVGDSAHDEKIVISFPFNHCEIGDYSDDSAYVLNIEIKYVHQLQNLYHALAGEELTLTDHE